MPDEVLGAANYTPVDAPIQRTLVVCKSSELPDKADRVKDTVYLVYDKMELHLYQSRYTDIFCIVESLNEDKELLTDRMLYITMDGEMYAFQNHIVYKLGELGDPDQADLLRQCGTAYVMNAESRYFDKQKRILQLPFQNGTYQLNLSLAKDIKIDEDTVIRYDPEKEQFYIAGKEYQFEDKLNNIYRYSGLTSTTVRNYLDDHTFRSEVRLSSKDKNDIKALFNGLYVSTQDLASLEDYLHMIEVFSHIKNQMDSYINQLVEAIREANELVTRENLVQIATEILDNYRADIENMFNNYNTLAERLATVEENIGQGFDAALEEAEERIKEYINQTNNAWTEVYEPEPYEPEEPEEPEEPITGAKNAPLAESSPEIVLKGKVLASLRKTFKSLRVPGDYSGGLTWEEQWVQNKVMKAFNSVVDSLDGGIEETSI